MSLNVTVTKKILENIIHETFSNVGFLTSSSLLDSLKLLGFYYATNAGISINIEDLRTPDLKKDYIETANSEMKKISQAWSEGQVSDQERFQSIIDSWNIATESLKNRIVEYYQTFDPANNLYIMAFSGARGNMSQVRQLVGMRGLMSDQEGKIIDLPIQTNFREGLSSIDYIISSYGARKGIVDTALKTADSGYLTRRLIYLAQDLVIREIDCKTKIGIMILLKKETSIKNLIGREILSIHDGQFPYSLIFNFSNDFKFKTKIINKINNLDFSNFLNNKFLSSKSELFENFKKREEKILTLPFLNLIKTISPIILKIRSSLTCESKGSICQKCYGWDLAQQKSIALGENIGIIAAQSIGEPGTQLTMRTFHTGGIFTGESLKQTLSPFSGKLVIPDSLKTFLYRTNHGIEVLKLQQETNLKLINWKGVEETIFLEIGSYLYILKTTFVYKGQLIAENLTQSFVSTQRKLKPIYTQIQGKIIFNDCIPILRRNDNGNTKRIILKQGLFWIIGGKIFSLPNEANYCFSNFLKSKKIIAKLKIITPKEGIAKFIFNNSALIIEILRDKEKVRLNLSDLNLSYHNCSVKIIPLIKNYHYVDKYTVLAFIYIFPEINFKYNKYTNFSEEIFSIEKKKSEYMNTFLISSKTDFWNFYGKFENLKLSKNLKLVKSKEKLMSKFFLSSIFEKEEKIKYLRTLSILSSIKVMGFNQNREQFRKKKIEILTPKQFTNFFTKIKYSGLYFKKDRYFNLLQNIQAICLPTNSLLNYIEFDYVLEKKIFATLVNYSQQTDDIVQGLPKIEELIEARQPKISSFLSPRPAIFLGNYITGKRTSKGIGKMYVKNLSSLNLFNKFKNQQEKIKNKIYGQIFSFLPKNFDESEDNINFEELEEKRTNKQIIILFHHLSYKKKNIMVYHNKLFKIHYLSPMLKPILAPLPESEKKISKDYYFFENQKTKHILKIQGRKFWEKKLIDVKLIESLWTFFKIKTQEFGNKDFKQTKIIKNFKEDFFYKATAKSKIIKEEIYLYQLNKNLLLCLEAIQTMIPYRLPLNSNLLFKPGEFIDIGEPINDGIIDSHQLLNFLFSYHSERDGIINGTIKSLNKFQLILVNSIQSIYQSQGVNISSKHIEIIVKQMTAKVILKVGGDTPFLPGELIPISLIINICEIFKINYCYKCPIFEPKLLSATNSSLNKDGFLSAAGFQETRRVLTKSTIEANSDWLRGLKESIISGRIMPAGSSFLNYKAYLDNFYHLKKDFKE